MLVMVSEHREKLGGYFFSAGSPVPTLPRYMHNTGIMLKTFRQTQKSSSLKSQTTSLYAFS